MKKTIPALIFGFLFLFGAMTDLRAANEDPDPITVTFIINTSTVADTLDESGVVQIRGMIEGLGDGGVTWDQNSVTATNVGGDYWEVPVEMYPGDVLTHKIWTGFSLEDGTGYNQGWETNNPDPSGDNYIFTVPTDATEDFTTDVIYVARPGIGREAPFDSEEEYVAIHFRVNVGGAVATGRFDPEDENQKIGVRGTIDRENKTFEYKYVIDRGGDNIAWEDTPNRPGTFPAKDTTLAWNFFNDTAPPVGDVITADLNFALNVSVLEDLDFFNRGLDKVYVRGQFNNFDMSDEMEYVEDLGLYTATVEFTQEVGRNFAYKYFIEWDASRFNSESPNFIPNLDPNNGWEEPGTFGGSDRVGTFTADDVQDVEGDFGTSVAYFNSIPPQGVIDPDFVAADEIDVTFVVDMTDAMTHPELSEDQRFNPDTDTVYVIIDTPFFALTQGLPAGDENPVLFDPEQLERVKMSRVDETNTYELVFPLQLPTENHIGFRLAYRGPDEKEFIHAISFDAGRRYYRYITPAEIDGDDVFWADEYTLDEVVWKYDNLDFPEPPDYGLADLGKIIADNNNNGPVTDLDWGSSLILSPEPKLDEDNRNYFYSGTLYLSKADLSSEQPDAQVARAYTLDQNYPNPFNPATNIRFSIPESQNVRLDVYNLLGQRVATLINSQLQAGTHTVEFNADRLASGAYIYRIEAGDFVQQRQMMLVK